jgi:hypothetical protein
MSEARLCIALLLAFPGIQLVAQRVVPTSCVIEGDVFDVSTGALVKRARIKMWTNEPGEPLYARTDPEGRFRIANAPLGFYYLWAEGPGYERNVSKSTFDLRPSRADTSSEPCCAYVFHDGLPSGTFSLSTDTDGVRHARISIPLLGNAVISGRVIDQEGFPLEGYAIETFSRRISPQPIPAGENEFGRYGFIVHTDDRGEFRATRPYGDYYVVVNKPEFLGIWEDSYRVTYYPHAMDQASAKLLELAPGQQSRLDIQIVSQSGARVAGHLIFPDAWTTAGSTRASCCCPSRVATSIGVACSPTAKRITNSKIRLPANTN